MKYLRCLGSGEIFVITKETEKEIRIENNEKKEFNIRTCMIPKWFIRI